MKHPNLLTTIAIALLGTLSCGIYGATTSNFQEGANGYAGTQDTFISSGDPAANNGSDVTIEIDQQGDAGEYILLRFENLFGAGPNQIPSKSTILSATLTVRITNGGNDAKMHRMLVPWQESSTWESLVDGVLADDVEAALTEDVTFPGPISVAVITLPVSTLQAWSDGTKPNHGWVFLPGGTDGTDFSSSEHATPANRPLLTVVWGTTADAGKITITEQPQDAKQEPGKQVTFSVKIDPLPSVTYQWLKNGTAIAGATSATYTTPALIAADNGAKFKVRMTAAGNSVESREAVLTLVALAAELSKGFLKADIFTGIGTVTLDTMRNDPKYIDNKPDRTEYVDLFEFPLGTATTPPPADVMNNYGVRITGFVIPAETANYIFYLAADDNAELYLSTNESPANEALIANEPSWNPVRAFGAATRRPGCPDACENKSASIRLVAGNRYWVRAEMKEAGGGDNLAVTWIKEGQEAPKDGAVPLTAAFIGVNANPNLASEITITEQPKDVTVIAPDKATFSVKATANPPALISVRWQRNGADIPGAVGATYTTDFLSAADAGKIRAVVTVPGKSVNSAEINLTVQTDTVAPAIARVFGADTFDQLTSVFSEPVTAATAGDKANYTLDGGLTVSSVSIVNSTTVKLVTSRQTVATTYTLAVKNIRDTGGNAVATDTKKTFTSFGPERGGLKFEAWFGIPGNPVQNLLDDPRYPSKPDESAYVPSMNSRNFYPNDSHEAYGGRMSGWIVPAETGQYEFFLRSDDASQLFLSTDDLPAKAAVIAEETGCCGGFEQPGAPETSAPVSLTAGKRYYIESLWKEGGGGDYCQVAWRKVGDTTLPGSLQPIPGQFLEAVVSPGTLKAPETAITSPADKASFTVGQPVTITASATSGGDKTITLVEFLRGGGKIGEARTVPFSFTIPNLSEDVYTFTVRATDSAGLSTISAPINISVGAQREKITLVAIDDKSVWRYDRSGQDLGTAWKEKNFNDSSWPQGKALIAEEPGATAEPIRTPISRMNDAGEYVRTFYFRIHFNLPGTSTAGVKLSLRHVVDDGAVFYLNGVEINRLGIAAGPVDFQTDATGHENAYEGPFDIPIASLVSGDNVLAAEVHQSGSGSSDMVFGAELVASVPSAGPVTPGKFNPPVLQAGKLVLSWTGTGALQSANDVTGPWADVANATPPFSVTPSEARKFYRLKP